MSNTISLPERFDFSSHKTFTDTYSKLLETTTNSTITVDFRQVVYLDSSALGMLILLNKRAKEKSCSVEIVNAKGNAKDILKIANFDKLMKIS